MKGFTRTTTDGTLTVEVDLRDQSLANDDVEVDIKLKECYGEDTRITTTRKNIKELENILSEALDYIGYPLKGF